MLGIPGFSDGYSIYTSIAVNASSIPYVAYRDSENQSKACVNKSNGTAWQNVGTPGISYGITWDGTLALTASGMPYVGYTDVAYGYKTTVMRFALPCSVTTTIAQTNASCNTANGTATVTATGGTAPYNYSWNTTPSYNTAQVSGLGTGYLYSNRCRRMHPYGN